MNNQFLIPANSKRSMLIFGLFEAVDLIILGVGLFLAIIMIATFYTEEATVSDIFGMLSPFLVTVIMVMPIPNHRNLWQLTVHIYSYFTNRRSYIWKGWCMTNGDEDK